MLVGRLRTSLWCVRGMFSSAAGASPWAGPPLLTPQTGPRHLTAAPLAESSDGNWSSDAAPYTLPVGLSTTSAACTRFKAWSPTAPLRSIAQSSSSAVSQLAPPGELSKKQPKQVVHKQAPSLPDKGKTSPTLRKRRLAESYDRSQAERAAAVAWGTAARRKFRQDPLKVGAARRLLPAAALPVASSGVARVSDGDEREANEFNDVQLQSTALRSSLAETVAGHSSDGERDDDCLVASCDATADPVVASTRRGQRRGVSAVSDYMYAHCVTYRLDADSIPAHVKGRKAIAAKLRKLHKQGVRVQERVNLWRRKREHRLVDKHNRIVLRTSELSDGRMFRHAWEGPNNPTSALSLLEELKRNYAGVDGRKVQAWCERQPNCRNHTRGVPFEVKPMHIRAERPMQHVQADMTHLPPTTYRGHYYSGLLTFVCCFSRHVFSKAVAAENGEEVAYATNEYFSYFGAAAELQTDNGGGFKSRIQKVAVNLHGSILKSSRPHRPEAQGNVERTHNLMKRLVLDLSVRAYDTVYKWPEFVPAAIRLYNNRLHRAFKMQLTPFMVMFGRAPNNTSGGDVHLLGGELVQDCPRLSLDEQLRILEECVSEPDLFGGGVIQRLIPLEILPDDDEDLEMECIYAVEEELQNMRLRNASVRGKRIRVAFTAAAAGLVMESPAHSFRLEYYRLMLQNVLQERYCDYKNPQPASVFGLVAEKELRDYLRGHGQFLAKIRDAAAETQQRYFDDIDNKLRQRMNAPYNPGDGVWVNPITAGRKFHRMGGKKHKAFSRSVAGTIVRMDESGGHHPYLVSLTLDTELASLCRCDCEVETWFPPSALKPVSAYLGKIMAAGVTEQLEGKCFWREETAYCTRDAGIHCVRKLCAEHCRLDEQAYCKRHYGNRLRKGRTRRLFEVVTEEVVVASESE